MDVIPFISKDTSYPRCRRSFCVVCFSVLTTASSICVMVCQWPRTCSSLREMEQGRVEQLMCSRCRGYRVTRANAHDFVDAESNGL